MKIYLLENGKKSGKFVSVSYWSILKAYVLAVLGLTFGILVIGFLFGFLIS